MSPLRSSPSPRLRESGSYRRRKISPSTQDKSTISKTPPPILRNNSNNDSATELEEIFENYSELGRRIQKSMYYANRLPSSPRPSFPLTVFAVNAFTSAHLGLNMDTLEYLDIDLASEIGRTACVSPTVVIMALVYLDRLAKENPEALHTFNSSELFVVSLLIGSKFVQDEGEEYGIWNQNWKTLLGFDTSRLNALQFKFLNDINWNVRVDADEFWSLLSQIEAQLSRIEGIQRGWFTYTEINSVSTMMKDWPIIYSTLIQAVGISFIIYIGIVTTIITTSIIAPHVVFLSHNVIMASQQNLPIDRIQFQNQPIIQLPNTSCVIPIKHIHKNIINEEYNNIFITNENETQNIGSLLGISNFFNSYQNQYFLSLS